MGDSALHVSPEEIDAAVKRVHEAIETLQKDFDSTSKVAEKVIGGSWTGHLADRAREGWDEWVDGYKGAIKALGDSADILVQAKSNYQDTDTDNATNVDQQVPDKRLNL